MKKILGLISALTLFANAEYLMNHDIGSEIAFTAPPGPPAVAVSCLEHYNNGNTNDGVYSVDPDGEGGNDSFNVYCDQTTEGGGWTLIFKQSNFATGNFRDYNNVDIAKLQSTAADGSSFGSLYNRFEHTETLVLNSSSKYFKLNGKVLDLSNAICHADLPCLRLTSVSPVTHNISFNYDDILVFNHHSSLSGFIIGNEYNSSIIQPWCSPIHGRYNGSCANGSYGLGNWLVYVK